MVIQISSTAVSHNSNSLHVPYHQPLFNLTSSLSA